jgi:predicted metal-dependent peptidase
MKKFTESYNDHDTDSKGKKWTDYDTITCLDGQVIDMQALLEEQSRAMVALKRINPEWGGLITKLRFIYTFHVKTQATDGYNLFVNPQFTYNLDFEQKVFVMAHEVMHCLLNHMRRGNRAGHEPQLSNVAADQEVNVTLEEIGTASIDTIKKTGAIYVKEIAGNDWGLETIYDWMKKKNYNPMKQNQQKQQQQQQQQQQNQQNQNQQGQGQGQGQPQDSDGEGQEGQGGGSGSGKKKKYSKDYKNGWQKAMAEWKAGKLKI